MSPERMAALALGVASALTAVRLGMSGRGRRRLGRLRPSGDLSTRTRPSPARRRVLELTGCLVVLAAVAGWAGSQAILPTLAALVVTGTVARLLGRHRSRVQATASRAAVSQACAVLAGQVRIGQVPSVALRSAAEDCPVLQPATDTVTLGGDPVACWRAQAERPGLTGLADLGRAWQLSTATGAELAPALEAVAEALSHDQVLELVIAAETSAPRATGRIMAVLPLVGIGLGYVMGGNPLTFLLHTAVGRGCFAVGALCACAGVLWMELVAERGAVDP